MNPKRATSLTSMLIVVLPLHLCWKTRQYHSHPCYRALPYDGYLHLLLFPARNIPFSSTLTLFRTPCSFFLDVYGFAKSSVSVHLVAVNSWDQNVYDHFRTAWEAIRINKSSISWISSTFIFRGHLWSTFRALVAKSGSVSNTEQRLPLW